LSAVGQRDRGGRLFGTELFQPPGATCQTCLSTNASMINAAID